MICFTYFGHKRSYWSHIISGFHCYIVCTSLRMYLKVNYYIVVLYRLVGQTKTGVPPPWNSKWSCSVLTLTVYQGKPRKNVCILSTVHTGVGIFSGAKAKPESVMYNNTKYGMDVPDQMRGRTLSKAVRKMSSGGLLYHPRPGWDQCPHLIQGGPAAGKPEGKQLTGQNTWRGKVGSSGSNHHSSSRHGHGGSAGPKELQTEPNVGHLKCHKPVCG